MSSRRQLLQEWTRQLASLLPGERITRVRVLALFTLGMLWASTVRVNQVAPTLPLGVRVPSRERRLYRFLTNTAVCPQTLWRPLLPLLLARFAGQEVTVVFDPTPYRDRFTVLWIGIVVHRRVLPLSWQIVPQQAPWPDQLKVLLPALLAPIAAALPPGCQVTLLGDRGLSGPSLLDAAAQQGWDVVLRVNVGASTAHRVRLLDANGEPGAEQRLWAVVGSVPSGWHAPAQIFKGEGWRTGYLTVYQRSGCRERWVLFSSRPGGTARVREYRRRSRVEATFADGKTRGWGLEHARLRAADHLDRLLLVWHLALWWAHALGRLVIRRGLRTYFDRTDRRDRSLLRLGTLWLHDELLHDRLPPLLFRQSATGYHARGTP